MYKEQKSFLSNFLIFGSPFNMLFSLELQLIWKPILHSIPDAPDETQMLSK